MKIAVVGTHDKMTEWMKAKIRELVASTRPTEDIIVTGCAEGVDRYVRSLSVRKRPLIVVHAAWDTFRQPAGPMRNGVLAEIADICWAFPYDEHSRGTWNCIGRFRALGKRVDVFCIQIAGGCKSYV